MQRYFPTRPPKPLDGVPGHIYVLTNKHMPGLVKIGFTMGPAEDRAEGLSRATGVPGRFKVERTWFVTDPRHHEQRIHFELRRYRVEGGGTELFKLSAPVTIERINVLLARWGLIDPDGLTSAEKARRQAQLEAQRAYEVEQAAAARQAGRDNRRGRS